MNSEDEIIELYKKDEWREILERYTTNSFLPWIWPGEEDLKFIGDCFRQHGAKVLISIGCGSGLFEWLLSKSTGIDVLGIELDCSWWTSKYAKKVFIPVCFLEEPDNCHERASASDAILLFCYFNNEKAFIRYIESFKGNCFIVIGPGPDKPTYTIPEPFSLPGGVDNEWKLSCHREIGNSKDFIAVYLRISNGLP